MNKTFYEHQGEARSNSAGMMCLLGMAVVSTTLMTGFMITLWIFVPLYLLFIKAFPRPETAFTIHLHPDQQHPLQLFLVEHFPWTLNFPWELFGFFYVVITLATGAAIIVVTRNKVRELWRAGGVGLARSLGGVQVTADGYRRDDRTQRAVNVVHEIAIAAKVPPPEVFVLHDEPAINAFAVGLTYSDMVVGLTAGSIQQLNREQLQGVVAHEFSHITHGDTRTNVLLVGYLHGLMAIIICAQSLLNKGMEFMVRSISHGGQGIFGMSMIAIGALLWPVGLVGLVCSTIVKAAYNRQREFLADATALEYARNQVGLAQAMQRILACPHGSRVRSARCLALSHVFFAQSCGGIAGFLDSHPPLRERIRRMDPDWDGQVQYEDEHEVGSFRGVLSGTMSIAQQARPTETGRLLDMPTEDANELEILDTVVMSINEHAARIKAALPSEIWDLTQHLQTAEGIAFALWANGTTESVEDDIELDLLRDACGTSHEVAQALKNYLQSYGLPEKLMLFDAAINQIRLEAQTTDLSEFCRKAEIHLASQDDSDLFRWAWRQTIQQIVAREQELPRPRPQYGDVAEVIHECQGILSALAYANNSDVMEGYSLMRASSVLGQEIELLPRDQCQLDAIDKALETLALLAPRARRKLVLAGSASIEADSRMNDEEALLMRGICSGLGYPPATLLPGQPIKTT